MLVSWERYRFSGLCFMLRSVILAGFLLVSGFGGAVRSEECPGNPDALGVSRLLPVSVKDGAIGTLSYKKTLDLKDHEVVLTFDDGPIARHTSAVLAALAHECVKATFFTVGTMAVAYPQFLQQEAQAGHTIGTHTWSHQYLNRRHAEGSAELQIAGGLHAAEVALGDRASSLSPFFRFPGFGRTRALDQYVEDHGLVAVSVDIVGDDWLLITPDQVLRRTLARLEQRGRGIVLLHDIHGRTAAMLPELLRELKARNFHIVHMVADHDETAVALNSLPEPQSPRFLVAMARARTRLAKLALPDPAPVAAGLQPIEQILHVSGPDPVPSAEIEKIVNQRPIQLARNGFSPATNAPGGLTVLTSAELRR